MISLAHFFVRALPVAAWGSACALVWSAIDRLHWLQGPGSWLTAASIVLLTCIAITVRCLVKVVDRACRGASSYTRALKAKRASQGLRSSVVDLALLLTAHEKRSVKDYAEAAIESPVNAVQRHSQGTGNSGASYSDVQAAGNAVGHGPRSQPDGRDQDISTHLKEMLHLLSLFHAASMASLRTAEDYSSYTKHQLPRGDPSEDTMAEQSAQAEQQTIGRQSDRLPGTTVPYPHAPTAFNTLKVSLLAHWRSVREQREEDTATRLLGLLVTFPALCCMEMLAFLQLMPGSTRVQKMELQRICPLTVILGVSKEEVDDLLSAREGAPRTVQVWLQDALLAPPEEDYYMEPSGAERAHLHQLLSAAAAASNETRNLVTARKTVLWGGTATALVLILATALPLFIASNVFTAALAAILSFVITLSFAAAHEAARSHDEPFASHSCPQEVAIAQQQHNLNEELLSVVRADFPGHCMNAEHALRDDVAVRASQMAPTRTQVVGNSNQHASAYSEAAMCTTNSNHRNACGSVALSMDVIPEPVSINMTSPPNAPYTPPPNSSKSSVTHAQHAHLETKRESHAQAMYPSTGGASDTSHTSGGSATSGRSEGRQLSTRISPPPPNAIGGPLHGHSRASSYDTTLAGLESLPSHFSPDVESDDSGSSGNTRAAVAALLRQDSDDSADVSQGKSRQNSIDGLSRNSSRTFSRAFSNLLPALSEDPSSHNLLFPDGVDATVNVRLKSAAKSSMKFVDTDACAASRVFSTCKFAGVEQLSTRMDNGDSDKLQARESEAAVPVCVDTCTLPINRELAALAGSPSGIFRKEKSEESPLTSIDGSLCMGRMHSETANGDSTDTENPLKDVSSGVFMETHDMHDRTRHMRCSSSAGSAVRASSRESSLSRRQSMKGDVVVDLGGLGEIPGPKILTSSRQSPVLDLRSTETALQGLKPALGQMQHLRSKTEYNDLKVSATRQLFGDSSSHTQAPGAQPNGSIRPKRRVAFRSTLFDTASTITHDSHASSGPWSTGALKLPGSFMHDGEGEGSQEPETPKNFQSVHSASAPIGVPDAMHAPVSRRAMRRLRPLSLDAGTCITGEEFGTPVSGLINPLCTSPRLEASKSNGSVSTASAGSMDATSPATHGPNTPSPTNSRLPPFRSAPLARMSSPDALLHASATKPSSSETQRGASAASIAHDVSLRHEKSAESTHAKKDDFDIDARKQSRSLNASKSSTTSADESFTNVRTVNSDGSTREPSTKEFIEKTMAAFTTGRLGPPSILSSRHRRKRSMHARHARHSGQVNPGTLTPLPRTCSVYSTDPDTDLARLLSPSDSDDSRTVVIGSLTSSKAASPNQSPRISVDTGREAPVATVTSSPNHFLSKEPSRSDRDGMTNSTLTVSRADEEPQNSLMHAAAAYVTNTFSSTAEDSGQSCMGAVHFTSSLMYLDDSQEPKKRAVRACNFDEGILNGYRGLHAGSTGTPVHASMHSSSGTLHKDSVVLHDSCEEISEDLPEAPESSPVPHKGDGLDTEISGDIQVSTELGADTTNACSSCSIMSPDSEMLIIRSGHIAHVSLQPSKAVDTCPKRSEKGEAKDPSTAELFEVPEGPEISGSFCEPVEESTSSITINEDIMHGVQALEDDTRQDSTINNNTRTVVVHHTVGFSEDLKQDKKPSSGKVSGNIGDNLAQETITDTNSLLAPSMSQADSTGNATEDFGNTVEGTSDHGGDDDTHERHAAGIVQLTPGHQWGWCTDPSKLSWAQAQVREDVPSNAGEPGSMPGSMGGAIQNRTPPHRKCSSAAARIQAQLDNFTKINENSIMSSGSFQPVYDLGPACGDMFGMHVANAPSEDFVDVGQVNGYPKGAQNCVAGHTNGNDESQGDILERFVEFESKACSTLHEIDECLEGSMHEGEPSDDSSMQIAQLSHIHSSVAGQKHERAATLANLLEAAKLHRRRDNKQPGGVAEDCEAIDQIDNNITSSKLHKLTMRLEHH